MISKKELLKSPKRPWGENSRRYSSVLIVPAGSKHDSGWMEIAIVGVYNDIEEDGTNIEKYEICGYPDDIEWRISQINMRNTIDLTDDRKSFYSFGSVRCDCHYPQGILRFWGHGSFDISPALSSVTIEFIPNEHNKKI